MRQLALTKATIVTPFHLIDEATILISGTKILDAGPAESIEIPTGFREIALEGLLIAPGFVDQHLHGGSGLTTLGGTVQNFEEIAQFHASHGTTSFLSSIPPCPREQLETIARVFGDFISTDYKGARCLGLHLEGPFLSPKYPGNFADYNLRPPSLGEILDIHKLSKYKIQMITLAPELNGSLEIASALKDEGINCSIGHSDADYDTTIKAITAGFICVTHCCNQMRYFHHRDPGIFGAALTKQELLIEIIVHEEYLHRATVDMIWRIKGPEGIVLVSDAHPLTGQPDGSYMTEDGERHLSNGVVKDNAGHLIGSALTMEKALKNMLEFTGCGLTDAFRMATYNPARLLGVNKRKGSIYPGKDADLIVLTNDLEVIMTMVGGKIISGLISLDD